MGTFLVEITVLGEMIIWMLTMPIIDIGHIISHEKVEVDVHAFDGTYDPNICVIISLIGMRCLVLVGYDLLKWSYKDQPRCIECP